jgi:hypothetical protein
LTTSLANARFEVADVKGQKGPAALVEPSKRGQASLAASRLPESLPASVAPPPRASAYASPNTAPSPVRAASASVSIGSFAPRSAAQPAASARKAIRQGGQQDMARHSRTS